MRRGEKHAWPPQALTVSLAGALPPNNKYPVSCRDKELAKFEAYLNKEVCQSINALVRGRTRMAYPIKG